MTNNLLVLQSDFGLVDGAISAVIGMALQEELVWEYVILYMLVQAPTGTLKLNV